MTQAATQPNSFFFIVSALAIYLRDGEQKQRHLNVVSEVAADYITKADLENTQGVLIQRLMSENNVPIEDIKDMVFLSISPLGYMPPKLFFGTTYESLDPPVADIA